VLASCLDAIRRARADATDRARPQWNRVVLSGWPVIDVPLRELLSLVRTTLAPMTEGLDLEQVIFRGRVAEDGAIRPIEVRVSHPPGTGLTVRVTDPPRAPMQPIDPYAQKVLQARRRGGVYPYELIPMLQRSPVDRDLDTGVFTEHDLDPEGRLVPVDRPYGGNSASIVVGTVCTPTARYPEGLTRVVLLGDPTRGLGSLAEPECRRVCEALDLAARLGVPVEWFAVSSGARIAMDSGTENMDWIARALRRIVLFTQAGGEINVIVAGINVGAQPYWNAEATMLMHTKGILVMTPDSAMVLTGKQALEYSGGVAAEDNFGIGGYDTVMGPNGQAQYWAPDLAAAVEILFAHYSFSYVAPGERFPRPARTTDPVERDIRTFPHQTGDGGFATIGDVFSAAANPDRKKPFDIRTIIRAVVDQDRTPLERWPEMAEAETAVTFDAFLGGYPVTVVGAESKALPRRGVLPADGPSQWTAGTLFPRSSKKLARAINAASGNRPVVVLANLSGFDGSPESLRNLQLEYGAEIARAVVNFEGPMVFCVVSRYHGGAFVVFSASLNDGMEVAAVQGSFASVIGGSPAAAVVFTGEVNARTDADPRLADLRTALAEATDARAAELRGHFEQIRASVRAEKLGELADEFERVHTIERARQVGSIDTIVTPGGLRPYLIDAVSRGIARCSGRP
jgi:acetyl-CoA carboxylase carboxyltransferase component